MRHNLVIILAVSIFLMLAQSYGEYKGREDVIKELETKLYIQTKTHYLMCVPKPSKELLIYRKRT